jgi:hypothetical protein
MPLFRGVIGGSGMCQARRLRICAMENFLSARQVYDGSAEIEEEPKIQCALEMICFKALSKG